MSVPETPSSMTLDHLSANKWGEVLAFEGSQELVRRLRELGFYEGAKILVKAKLFFWGPVVVSLNSCSLALRRSEAQALVVRPIFQEQK